MGFLGRLGTILTLRVLLYFRRLKTRGWAIRIAGYVSPIVSLAGLLVVAAGTGLVLDRFETLVGATAAVSLVLLAAHAYLLFSVTARVTANQSMAAALYSFPLSPAVIHSSEAAAGLMTPAVAVPSVIVLASAAHVGAFGPAALLWGLLVIPYLAGLRQLLALALGELLRRRFMRELAFVATTSAVLGAWIAINRALATMEGDFAFEAWLEAKAAILWWLPSSWFLVPTAALDVEPAVRLAGLLGAPVLTLAIFVVGYELQDAACYGEAPSLVRRRRGGGRRRRRWHLAERRPFVWLPAAIWATARKEVTVLRRNTYLVFSLGTQAALMFLPVVIFEPDDVRVMAGGWVRMVAVILLFVEHSVLFNQIGSEGRALAFLTQTPVSRLQVLLGKNLGYGAVLLTLNVGVITGAAFAFSMVDELPVLLAMVVAAQAIFTGVGNFVSAWLPYPIVGARAQVGGTRAATTATGDVEPPGCGYALMRGLILQGVFVLLLPAAGLLYGVWWLAPEALVFAMSAAAAYAALIYVAGTLLAVRRLETAEDKLLALIAVKGAG